MDIGGWLRSLGLERYEAVFSENAIDASVLHDLTEDHLRELGFPLGARLKLLRAIAALDAVHPPSVTTSIAGTPAQSADAATATLTPETAGERRQVTVMRSSSRDILKIFTWWKTLRIGKSHTTRCRLKSSPQDGRLVAEERGSHELKGVPEPVTLFQIIRVSGGGRRARAK